MDAGRSLSQARPLLPEAAALAGWIALSYPIGLALDPKFVLPLLNALPAWWVMVRRLREGDRRGAVILMLVFPVALALFGVSAFSLWPTSDGAAPPVLNGDAYRTEMFHWISTGEGAEGNWRQFLPQHISHLAGFVVLSLASASLVSITGGAVLTNYMNAYVASIHRAGAPLWATVFFGWQPWAICRVAGFCILGVVLAEPLLKKIKPYAPASVPARTTLVRVALALILADWLLKATLAPTWGRILRAAIP